MLELRILKENVLHAESQFLKALISQDKEAIKLTERYLGDCYNRFMHHLEILFGQRDNIYI